MYKLISLLQQDQLSCHFTNGIAAARRSSVVPTRTILLQQTPGNNTGISVPKTHLLPEHQRSVPTPEINGLLCSSLPSFFPPTCAHLCCVARHYHAQIGLRDFAAFSLHLYPSGLFPRVYRESEKRPARRKSDTSREKNSSWTSSTARYARTRSPERSDSDTARGAAAPLAFSSFSRSFFGLEPQDKWPIGRATLFSRFDALVKEEVGKEEETSAGFAAARAFESEPLELFEWITAGARQR